MCLSNHNTASELKNTIMRSRYQAARLVNGEILMLYFSIGKRLSEKIKTDKWGAKVLENISNDLQNELPGLRGFSVTNLKKMRQFAEAYSFFEIRPLITDQIENDKIRPLSTAQLKISIKTAHHVTKNHDYPFGKISNTEIDILTSPEFSSTFFSISFTHHILLLNKIRNWDELFFYLTRSVENQWTVPLLQNHIEADLFKQKGRMQTNFEKALPQKLYPHALLAFRDEYLLDFLNIQDDDEPDERVIENEIVLNIKKFILSIGREFTFMGNQHRLLVGGDEFY